MLDLARFAVEFAAGRAEYAEARFEKRTSDFLVLKNGSLESIGTSRSVGLGVRVLVNGAFGFVATNRLDKSSVKQCVARAVRIARSSAALSIEPIKLSSERMVERRWRVRPKLPFHNVPVDEKIELLIDLDKEALAAVRKVKLPARVFELIETQTTKYFVNSEGASILCQLPRIYFEWTLTALKGGDSEQDMLWKGATQGYEALREWKLLERVEERARVLERILLKARRPPGGRVDVVVGKEVVGLIVHETVGHPYEADRILGREAAQAGESFVTPEMVGQDIDSKLVTVVDDPLLKHSYGYYEFDDEGVRARRRFLLREGRINEFLHNRETAARLGVKSNAAARASSFNREPLVRMANTFMLPGDRTLEELFEGVELGVYMKTFGEWNIDDRRWNFRFVGRECYLIRHGRLDGMVRRPRLELTTPHFYSSIDAIDDSLYFDTGTCGKGDPMQAMPVWFGGPDVRLRGVRVR